MPTSDSSETRGSQIYVKSHDHPQARKDSEYSSSTPLVERFALFHIGEGTMYLSIAALFFLLHIGWAGQRPFGHELHGDGCSIPAKEILRILTPALERGDHVSDSCSHYQRLAHKDPVHAPSSWTQQATCMPRNNSTETYCVYTNDVFANGRGISFFTSPSIAEKIMTLPAFASVEKHLYDKVNEFGFSPWEISSVTGKGKGLFATQRLSRGDPIIASTPVGIYHAAALKADYNLNFIYLHTAFTQLPKTTQQLYLGPMAASKGDPIMERINTNAFSGNFEGSPHFLMYPETAVNFTLNSSR
jgi:hypothetical protein